MAEVHAIRDMPKALSSFAIPTITVWNRLEGRPRSVDFDRSLRAEVRDALWFLTRQWQVGEFEGDDAGSPVTARFQLSRSTFDGYQAADAPAGPYDAGLPLEAVVEQRRVEEALGNGGLGLIDLRAALGRRFLKLIPAVYHGAFIERYGFVAPDPEDPADTERVAHLEVWSTLQALAGRALDGWRLHEHLDGPGHLPWDGLTVLDADKPALTAAAAAFREWFESLLVSPEAAGTGSEATAWDPNRLEHRFAVTTSVDDGAKRLEADEYPGGRLDWTAFSVDPSGARGGGRPDQPLTVLPAPTRFDGMPDPRWWTFEDGRTNLGDVRADTTDLARLLFVEFGLVYGNDWYTIPVDVAVGSVARVEGLVVTNVFGERRWIEPAGRGVDDDWQRWTMFTLDVAGTDRQPADTSLLVAPTVVQSGEGRPLEDVVLLRDEIANQVWGVERTVPLATGVGKRGSEAAAETLAHRTRLVQSGAAGPPAPIPDPAAPISYRVMTGVPEHWIPFVPVHVPGDIRETQLQRAVMPRTIEGDPTPAADERNKVRPRTSLLRPGLDVTPRVGYPIHEEEVPRAGTQVRVAFQRTRWRDGRVAVWLGTHRQTGRGEASSGLAFDQIIDTPLPAPPP